MSTELTRIESRIPRKAEINDLGVLANHLAKSGLFKDARGGLQAFAKLLFGRDLGLSATAAMTGVHIIEGKPEIGANLQAQMVRTYIGPEGERYDYKVREHTEDHCKIEFSRRRDRGGEWEVLGDHTYTKAMAEKAGLWGKGNWKKHPMNMLFARAMTDGCAFHCPEVTNGIRTYHEGEIEIDSREPHPAASADVPIDGEIIDATPEPERPAVEAPTPADRADLDALRGLLDQIAWSDAELAMHLAAVGVDDVGDVDAAIAGLTGEQATELATAAARALGGEQ